MRTTLICNPQSGRGIDADGTAAALRDLGLDVVEIAHSPQEAAAEGVERIVVMGGDGTLAPAAALAQAEHEAPKGGLLTPNGGLMIWTLVIFLVLMAVLSRFAFGPITAAVAARERALEEALAAAQRDREEAARVLEEHRRQVERTNQEAQRWIAEGRAAGEGMRAEMLEETRRQQQEMLERARREIESEKQRAIAQLRAEAVDLALAGASKVIEKNLDDQGNRRIVEDFLASVGTRAAKG
jgi:F-type H+-transporting ATPase subunit b